MGSLRQEEIVLFAHIPVLCFWLSFLIWNIMNLQKFVEITRVFTVTDDLVTKTEIKIDCN